MGMYEVPLSVSLLGFGIGTITHAIEPSRLCGFYSTIFTKLFLPFSVFFKTMFGPSCVHSNRRLQTRYLMMNDDDD